ncbi:DUF1566 domain-containing protein [Thiothrix subterranea]|uniref:Lcl C-terminal domain-containing protein n=1 Tax=Thiothrix subterranea TaxID=2735563 RepID=UPI00192A7D0F|nr:DUF1566 domain-containing protein [Thiothrix subterranea]QQZ28567.1 DUF1566 domain-containing protein [Thiothrix subterranea]
MNQRLLSCALLGGLLLSGLATAQTCTNTAMEQSTPTSAFTFNSDGTATHQMTGLVWKRCLEGQTFTDNGTATHYLDDQCTGQPNGMEWAAALNLAQTAGQGWRVPDQKELSSIVEHCRVDPAINTEVFPGSGSYWVWSSSPVVNYPDYASDAWFVYFDDGSDVWDDRYADVAVRLVRSGQ